MIEVFYKTGDTSADMIGCYCCKITKITAQNAVRCCMLCLLKNREASGKICTNTCENQHKLQV